MNRSRIFTKLNIPWFYRADLLTSGLESFPLSILNSMQFHVELVSIVKFLLIFFNYQFVKRLW